MSAKAATQRELDLDRRRVRRVQLVERAMAIFGPDNRTIGCVVLDISDGARLEFGTTLGLPDEFRLLILTGNRIARVQIVWRSNRQVGVRVIGQWS